jgi:hypothetical protein
MVAHALVSWLTTNFSGAGAAWAIFQTLNCKTTINKTKK